MKVVMSPPMIDGGERSSLARVFTEKDRTYRVNWVVKVQGDSGVVVGIVVVVGVIVVV